MPRDMPEDMPDRMADRMPDRMPEDMSEYMPEDMPDRMPEDMSDRMPEDMPDRMPEDLPDRMPEDMPEHMPEDMPDRRPNRMSEDMSDRMPEDLPVRKCINVMVGITRSKVIFHFAFLRQKTICVTFRLKTHSISMFLFGFLTKLLFWEICSEVFRRCLVSDIRGSEVNNLQKNRLFDLSDFQVKQSFYLIVKNSVYLIVRKQDIT